MNDDSLSDLEQEARENLDDEDSDVDRDEAEEKLKGSADQRRHRTPGRGDDVPSLSEAIVDAYGGLDSGDLSKNITVRDQNVAALLQGLEDSEQLGDVTADARRQLGADEGGDPSRSELIRALLRLGLAEADPTLMETTIAAKRDYESDQEESF